MSDYNLKQQSEMEMIVGGLKKFGTIGGIVLLSLILIFGSFVTVNSGDLVRVQNNLSGDATWYTTEGIKFKVPFFSSVKRYPQEITIGISDNDSICDTASKCGTPNNVQFADTYRIKLETNNRYSLPRSPDLLEKMHDKVKNVDNLIGTVLLPFSKDLLTYTSAQFRAEDFMQGGQNEYKARLIDQAENGLLVTKRVKVQVKAETADRDSKRESGTKVGKQFMQKVVIVNGEDGNPKRNQTTLKTYGISLVPAGINLVEYLPEETLKSFMADKQGRVRARAKIVEDQQNEREKAITAQLKGNRERIEKQNSLLVKKDAAIIQGEQSVAEAKLKAEKETVERNKVAELAIIDKKRELQVAKANEGIQRANAISAKHQAAATKEIGFAEAAVARAKLKAKQDNKVIYIAELKLEEAKVMAAALPKTNITMPQFVNIGGDGGSGSNLTDLLSTKMTMDIAKGSSK